MALLAFSGRECFGFQTLIISPFKIQTKHTTSSTTKLSSAQLNSTHLIPIKEGFRHERLLRLLYHMELALHETVSPKTIVPRKEKTFRYKID